MRDSNRDLRLEINEYADMTYSEFIKIRGGLIVENKTNDLPHVDIVADAPTSLDWREKGVVNPVKDQGQCGSCWAFSTVGSVESRWALKSGNLLNLSEQEIVDCDTNDYGCNGGWMDHAFLFLETNKLESESNYPYQAVTNTCTYNSSEGLLNTNGYTDIEQSDEGLINALQDGPISVAVAANSAWQL